MARDSSYGGTSAGFVQNPGRTFTHKPKASFELAAPKYGDDGWEVVAHFGLMYVSDRSPEPLDDAEVQFLLDGEPYGKPVRTNARGQAKMRYTHLAIGKHTFGAQMVERPDARDSEERDIAPKVSVDVSEPVFGDDGAEVTATAYVSIGGAPVSGIELQFLLDEQPVDIRRETGDDGRQQQKFTKLKKGSHVVGVLIPGTTIRGRSKSFEIKEEKVEVPAEIIVDKAGREGKYDLTITIISGKGIGMVGRAIQIHDPLDPKPFGQDVKRTGEFGIVTHRVEFTNPTRAFRFSVLGTKIAKTVWLSGPQAKVAPPAVTPEAEARQTAEEAKKGAGRITSAFRRGWKVGKR